MALADALKAEAVQMPKGPRCTVCTLVTTLDHADKSALITALASEMSSSGISRALASEGHRISPSTVARHRREECLREPQ